MWTQMNTLTADGANVEGINLPHIVSQHLEVQVQYKTAEIIHVYWLHYTPDILVVPVASPIKTFAELLTAAKKEPGKLSLAGSGLNSVNHAAHERLYVAVNVKLFTSLQGHGRLDHGCSGQPGRRRHGLHAIRDP